MPFDKRTLVIPDDTKFEERTVLTTGDIVIGNHASLEFGVKTSGRVFIGESASIGGSVHAERDVRIDMFSRVDGDVVSGKDVFFGERVKVGGKLSLVGDLDVGDDVAIAEGFEAKGWINIRHPIPMVIYVFLYLLEMMRLGRSEEVERVLSEIDASNEQEFVVSDVYLYVPDGSSLGLTQADVKGNLRIGKGCRVLGNFAVRGSVVIGDGTTVVGAIRATGGMSLGAHVEVQGECEGGQLAAVGEGSKVMGNLRAKTVELHHSAIIEGTLTAPGGVRFVTKTQKEMEEKVARFKAGQLEDLKDLLH